jgi:hypothetical protein
MVLVVFAGAIRASWCLACTAGAATVIHYGPGQPGEGWSVVTGWATRMRTALDLWRQLLWQYRVTVTGVFLAIFSAVTVLTRLPTSINVSLAIVGVLVGLLEVWAIRRRFGEVVFQPRKGDDYADLAQRYEGQGRILRTSDNVGLVLTEASKRLRQDHPTQSNLEARVDQRDFVLRDELAGWALPFLMREMRRSTMHNGSVVGLATDLPADHGSDNEVLLRRVGYYDFVSTNILAGNDVWKLGGGARLNGRRLFVDRNGRLRDFTDSWLANTIGVSTLAITEDGKLLLPFHTKQNVGNPEQFPPSGSGALEQQDLPPNGKGKLSDIIIHGAERELCEECALLPAEIHNSAMLGHARWFTRGAMPEFAAVTLVAARSGDIETRKVRRSERSYIKMVTSTSFTPRQSWDPLEPLKMIPPEFGGKASWPLAFALSCLAEAMTDPSFPLGEEIRRLLP